MKRTVWAVSLVGSSLLLALACSPADTIRGSEATSGAGGTPVSVECDTHCNTQHPGGADLYASLRGCLLCGACFDVCNGEVGPALCPDGGMELGSQCSMKSGSCDACINSACAVEQLSDTKWQGACAAEGQACSDNTECVNLNNCVVTCIQDGGIGSGGGGGGNAGSGGAGQGGS